VRFQPLERAFAWITNQCHQQPAEDQKGLRLGTAEEALERVEKLVYVVGEDVRPYMRLAP